MLSLARRLGRFRGVAVAAAVAGVLAGLVGMHVLGLHGVQREAAPGTASAPHDHGHGHHIGSAEHAKGAVRVDAQPGAGASSDCCDHGHGMDGLMLCLALVVAGGVLGALARRLRGEDVRSWTPRVLARTHRRRTSARAGPPYLMAYSVIRC